ncbi:helix-turn-helix domain-containing protein [Lacrimispora amygdalina]|uniref:helix-turn-helix domain-containing protein n=1 Tax=Lacrimispora amygdalina TaxID=253257 RepID=UPI001FA908F8|nr:helix-turn-helix domain-containing protein [Clostridium indicum]
MMTKQAELKQQAYASNLKSRALSILIYLIDRSNKDLTCFPAIPTMAEQLHISVSTVKRALKELADAGYIQKEARFREKNRGQSSNLYTLLFVGQMPTPDDDNVLAHEDYIEPVTPKSETGKHNTEVVHITFDYLKNEKQEKQIGAEVKSEPVSAALSTQKKASAPIHFAVFEKMPIHNLSKQIREVVGQFLPCSALSFQWTGVESILQPP